MNQDEIAELKKQFAEHASWGFVSRYGRTGRILSVRAADRTLEIATPRGTLHARVGAATNIHQTTNDDSRALTFEDLTPGTLVTVDGATGTEENYVPEILRWCLKAKVVSTSRRQPALAPVSCRCSPSPLVCGQAQRGNNGPTHRNCSLVRER